MQTVKLNSGYDIPVVGSGTNTYGKVDGDYQGAFTGDTTELRSAIEAGYRHFDTAIAYRNEAAIGTAWRESGLARDAFFITSKIPGEPEYMQDEATIRQAVSTSLAALQTDYLDLYLIHHPWDDLAGIVQAWKVLEACVEEGLIRSIGVSNFNEEQLAYLLDNAQIKPAVNQVESHPGKWQDEVISFGASQGVVAQAWGPIKHANESARQQIQAIGDRYGKSWAQVVLNYQVSRGVVVLPKSHNPQRQAENLAIFDFSLTDEERTLLASL